MKTKLILLMLIISALVLRSSGQVTYEHTYSGAAEVANAENLGYKYFVTDYLNNLITIYNEDHSLYKEVNLPVPLNQYLYDVAYVSTKLFNTDDQVELLMITYQYFSTSDTSGYYLYTTKVVNENGTTLVSVPGGAYSFTFTDNNNKNKLVVYVYDYSVSTYIASTQVYGLPDKVLGTVDPGVDQHLPFPNPASSEINLPFDKALSIKKQELVIRDSGGKEYIRMPLMPGESFKNINTSSLPSGTYYYNTEGSGFTVKAGKFVKL